MRLNRALTKVIVLVLLLLGAVVVSACSEHNSGRLGYEEMKTPQGVSSASSIAQRLPPALAPFEDHRPVGADGHGMVTVAPCAGSPDVSCAPRNASQFNLLAMAQAGGAYGIARADELEDILEMGLDLVGASPTHLAVRGTTVSGSVRCDWRGVARTAVQREKAIRFWLGLAASDPLPSAAEAERRFMAEIDGISAAYPETSKANFRALARGGLTTEYVFLACYVDVTASEYILGAGPTTLTLGYNRMGEASSYSLYQLEHAAGQFGDEALLGSSAYQAGLDQMVADAEAALSGILEGRESVVFLAPMGAHHAIAIEAWQVVAQWDVQTVDGTVSAVRYGAYEGDPEHTQTLANLSSRITTAAASDAFADNRIANASGLQAYYTTIGAYGDITPDDGQTTTFTPAQPPPMRPCANGTAVPNPRDNRMLVQCDAA